MAYPPFPVDVFGDLEKVPKKELKERFKAFVIQIPARLDLLTHEVRRDSSFANWHPDHSPESIASLGGWFAEHVTTRPRTDVEVAAIEAGNPFPIDIERWDLSAETQFMAVDVGIYFAESLRARYPQLEWGLVLDDRRNFDYGSPALFGFSSRVPLNSFRIVTVFAYGVAARQKGAGRLLDVYEEWSADAAGKWQRGRTEPPRSGQRPSSP